MGRKGFYDELNKLYGVEEFTGHLGVLLGTDDSFENDYQKRMAVQSAMDFLQSVYDIAVKNL